jgi:hypothetical protein
MTQTSTYDHRVQKKNEVLFVSRFINYYKLYIQSLHQDML